MPDSTPIWGFASPSSAKPAPMRTLSKRRAVAVQQSHPSHSAHAHADAGTSDPAYLFPRQCASDEELRRDRRDPGLPLDSATPDAFGTQRAVRRKKSSFDLRDLFLTGGVPRHNHDTPSGT